MKIIRIEKCGGCPWAYEELAGDGTVTIDRCMGTDQMVKKEGIPDWCPLPDDKDYTAIANNVKTLVEAQRCEWVPFYQDPDYDDGNWNTGCGQELFYDYDIREHLDSCPFCPCCGKRIHIKED